MSVKAKAPWWFWVVSVTAVLWNAIGPFDFYNSVTLNEEYLSAFPGYLEFMQTMPLWAKTAWGIAVFAALLASLALLFRRAFAVPLFIISIIAMVISFAYQFLAPVKPDVPAAAHIMTVIIWVVAFFLLWFSIRMSKKNVIT